jgi:hypothetical protein
MISLHLKQFTKLLLKYAGVENGLRLTMNIEQYEYMPGPHDAAGIKMLLHDPNEIPRVHALGQAIPPGSHVFVGVKMIEVRIEHSWYMYYTWPLRTDTRFRHFPTLFSYLLDVKSSYEINF